MQEDSGNHSKHQSIISICTQTNSEVQIKSNCSLYWSGAFLVVFILTNFNIFSFFQLEQIIDHTRSYQLTFKASIWQQNTRDSKQCRGVCTFSVVVFIYINEWMELKAKFLIKILSSFWFSRVLCKTVEGGDGKKLITQDKKRTWICEIRLTFVPSCSRVRRQLLHFHVVCKTVNFRRTRWRQMNFSENRNKQCNQSKSL